MSIVGRSRWWPRCGAIWTPHNLAAVRSRGLETENEIAESSGKKRLDDAAIKYGMRMAMRPATENGQAQTGCATQPVLFSLKDAR